VGYLVGLRVAVAGRARLDQFVMKDVLRGRSPASSSGVQAACPRLLLTAARSRLLRCSGASPLALFLCGWPRLAGHEVRRLSQMAKPHGNVVADLPPIVVEDRLRIGGGQRRDISWARAAWARVRRYPPAPPSTLWRVPRVRPLPRSRRRRRRSRWLDRHSRPAADPERLDRRSRGSRRYRRVRPRALPCAALPLERASRAAVSA